MGGPGSGRSKKPIHRTRKKTTYFCRFRSKRKPKWTEADAARTCCAAIRNGGSMRLINARVQTLCPPPKPGDDVNFEGTIAQTAQEAISQVDTMDGVLGEAYQEFLIINGIIGAIVIALALFGRFPGLRIVARRAVALQAPINVVMGRVQLGRKAANEARHHLEAIINKARLAA